MFNYNMYDRFQEIGVFAYLAESTAACYVYVKYNCQCTSPEEVYYRAFLMSALPYIDIGNIKESDINNLAANSISMSEDEALTYAASSIIKWEIDAEVAESHETHMFIDTFNQARISMEKENMRNTVKDVLRMRFDHPIYKAIGMDKFRANLEEVITRFGERIEIEKKSTSAPTEEKKTPQIEYTERKAAASTGSETVTLNTQLKNRKKKIGETLFTAEFLAANYYYTEHYRNYRCWEQLYFTAFIMSAYDLLDNNILTPEGLKSLARGSTEKDAVDALTDAVLYFAQCRINAQNEGYKKEFALQDMVSQKDAVRKSIISVLKKGEKHPIFRASDYYDKKLLYSNVAHYAEGMTFTPVQSERTHSPAVPVGNAGRRVKKVFVFIGIISLHFIGNVLVNMGRNAMIARLNVWDIGYFIKVFFITMITVVAYLSITTPLAIRYLIRYARET